LVEMRKESLLGKKKTSRSRLVHWKCLLTTPTPS
jgi:hypothetical protein